MCKGRAVAWYRVLPGGEWKWMELKDEGEVNMQYNWVKCSERMPPKDEAVLTRRWDTEGRPQWFYQELVWNGADWMKGPHLWGADEWLDPGSGELDRLAALVRESEAYSAYEHQPGTGKVIFWYATRRRAGPASWMVGTIADAIAHLEAQRPVTVDDLRQAWEDYFSVVDVTADFVGSHFADVLNRYLEQEDDREEAG